MPKKRLIAAPTPKQGPHFVVKEPSDDVRPRWCFAHLRSGYHASDLQRDHKALLLDHLVRRSALTWKEIKVQSHQKLGYEAIDGAAIKDGIPDIAAGRVIFCFRMGDQGRFLGVRKDETFHIVWIDCQFDLYDH